MISKMRRRHAIACIALLGLLAPEAAAQTAQRSRSVAWEPAPSSRAFEEWAASQVAVPWVPAAPPRPAPAYARAPAPAAKPNPFAGWPTLPPPARYRTGGSRLSDLEDRIDQLEQDIEALQ